MSMDIVKIIGVFIQDGKYLVARDGNEDFFKNVGGRVEGDEADIACLKRQLGKEIGYVFTRAPELLFDFPPTSAKGDPGKNVVLRGYLMSKDESLQFVLKGDVAELAWVNTENQNEYKMTPQIPQLILPKLKELGLIR